MEYNYQNSVKSSYSYLVSIDFTKYVCKKREKIVVSHHILRTSGNCRNTNLTHFTQKFRENNGFTKEITK